ncbi:MAG: hypothetical protein ABFD89_06700 [Bryobacteraceae bacterium]
MSATKKPKAGGKAALSCRVSRVVKALIALERKRGGGSEGESVERLVLHASVSPEARQLMLRQAAADPHLSAMLDALRHTLPEPAAGNQACSASPPGVNSDVAAGMKFVAGSIAADKANAGLQMPIESGGRPGGGVQPVTKKKSRSQGEREDRR